MERSMNNTAAVEPSHIPSILALSQGGVGNPIKQRANCRNCSLRKFCLPCGLTGRDMARAEEAVYTRKPVKRGDGLYFSGDPFVSLYALRSGFFKTTLTLDDGRDQVVAFHMSGDMLGMDSIGTDTHESAAIALEDSEVCVIPYTLLQQLTRDIPQLNTQFHKVMSRELVREYGVIMLLGSMRAEERVVAFLLNLAQRFEERGYSKSTFLLRMSREEIGSYLGLQLETVSRAFSRLQECGSLSVQQRHIEILNFDGFSRALAKH
jgi:CRP/FNR family transcriptional regulator